MAITESERCRIAQALNGLRLDGTEADQRQIGTVIGHLTGDEADEVMKLALAMHTQKLAADLAVWPMKLAIALRMQRIEADLTVWLNR
jgi:hypothetical protein